MLSEKPWNREVLLLLFAGLLVCWCGGLLLEILLEQFLPLEEVAKKPFYHFLISTLSVHVAPLFLIHQFLKLNGTTWREFLGLTGSRLRQTILFAILVAFLVLPVVWTLNEGSAWLLDFFGTKAVPQPSMKALESAVNIGQQICFGVAAILLAPLAEEALFRGILYPFIKQRGRPVLAVLGTSFVFGAFHSNLLTFLPLVFFAIVLIFVYEKTDKLLAPVLTHAVFNAVNFLTFLFGSDVERWLHRMK